MPDTARHMEELLATARERDAELRRTSEGASHAGEADPYRHDDEPGAGTEADAEDEATEGTGTPVSDDDDAAGGTPARGLDT